MIHASTTDSSEEKERILRLRSQVAEQNLSTMADGQRSLSLFILPGRPGVRGPGGTAWRSTWPTRRTPFWGLASRRFTSGLLKVAISRGSRFRQHVFASSAPAETLPALGKAIREMVKGRPERVVIIASGGMSHYPGTWKYPQPAYDFDYWAIAQMERGNLDPILALSSEQLDEVGNTEMLPWYPMFGAIGNVPGELITYQPTWHHGHAVMRFLPNKRKGPPTGEIPPAYNFTQGGFEFYKHPQPSSYALNKVLYELRLSSELRKRFFKDTQAVAREYGLNRQGIRGARDH